jgi:dihydroxyacetone kinase DhaKLM complex PTS-EIIA-like component DhaM
MHGCRANVQRARFKITLEINIFYAISIDGDTIGTNAERINEMASVNWHKPVSSI